MRRSHFFTLLCAVGLLLAGCSKKETTAAKPADQAQPPTLSADAGATASAEADAGIQFRLPGSDSGAYQDQATPVAPIATGETGKSTLNPPEMHLFYPPFYPLSRRMEGEEGQVDLGITIDATGHVAMVQVLATTAPQFREYALEAAKHWRFRPALLDGKPTPLNISFPVSFVSEFGTGTLNPRSPLAGLSYVDGLYYVVNAQGKLALLNLEDPVPILRLNPPITPEDVGGKDLKVVLSFGISTEGQVIEPRVQTGSGNAFFDEAALVAVRFWRFIPRVRNGAPIASQVRLPVTIAPPAEAAAPDPG